VSYAIDVTHLVVDFSSLRAVDDVSFNVAYGQVTTLLGPNGAGKTTLVETLLGFRGPTSGSVRVHGLDPLRDHAEVVVRTGALLQRGGVWFPMTPAQVLTLTATYYDQPREPHELLALLSLENCAHTPWRRLSGGEQQRTLLALALLGRPRVLVLDEPTTAVDPEGRQVIRELIRAERDRGCALLITTHELTEAERLSDHLVIMNHGGVVVQGSPEDLAGDAMLIIETSVPVDPVELSRRLGGVVVAVTPTQLHCQLASSPERVALVSAYLSDHGASLTSLRTRASLEERYLELIAASAREAS
jgi:ABC-2 type transport system ATP-binding protein